MKSGSEHAADAALAERAVAAVMAAEGMAPVAEEVTESAAVEAGA